MRIGTALETAASPHKVEAGDALAGLSRDALKQSYRELGVDDGGGEKVILTVSHAHHLLCYPR